MLEKITQAFTYVGTTVGNALYSAGEKVTTTVNNSWTTVGRKVERLADDYLHPKIAEAVKKIFWGLPYMTLSLLLPLHWSFTLYAGYHIAQLLIKEPFPRETVNNLNVGLGNAMLVKAIQNTALCVTTGRASFVVAAAINLFFAGLFHGNVKEEPVVPAPDPKDAVTN